MNLLRHPSRRWAPFALAFLGLFAVASADVHGSRDVLWMLLACFDPARIGSGDQCIKPHVDSIDNRDPKCSTTTQVWAQSEQYVAMRDHRMCNCPEGFVHGLAMPFARIAGIEADQLPEGIWAFAWNAAHTKIADENTIALAVNPPAQRTQDQLHIHLVRRREGVCEGFAARDTVPVSNLDHVWEVAKIRAAEHHVTNYSVLVTKCSPDTFTVLVEEVPAGSHATPESQYTQHDCH